MSGNNLLLALRNFSGTQILPTIFKIIFSIKTYFYLTGTALALSEIQDICVVSMKEDLLRLIGEKCRGLKQVSFDQKYFSESPERSQISPLSLRNVLREWPEV